MKVKFNREEFLQNVLLPASRFDNAATLKLGGGMIGVVAYKTTANNSQLFLISDIKVDVGADEELTLNIGDLRKFIVALKNIPDVEVELECSDAMVSYDSDSLRFRFHLIHNGAMKKLVVSRESINALVSTTMFNVSSETVKNLLLVMSCMPGVSKLYIRTDNGVVRCTQTDKTIPSTDSIDIVLSNEFTGKELDDIIICEDVFRLMASSKFDICRVGVTDSKAVIFEIGTNSSTTKYIVPCKVK